MRIFIACLGTETNTFSPLPTGLATYQETGLFHGDATHRPATFFSDPLHVWRSEAEAAGHTVIEGLCAFAQPAGRTIRRVYEDLRDELLGALKAALPVDIVLINMHGAMAAEGYDDCEGDLLERARAIVGPGVVIGGELDLHCHLTEKMRRSATVLHTYKEYPHTDVRARAHDLFRLCRDAAEGRTRPVMAMRPCRMISMWRTSNPPIARFVAAMKAREGKDGILAVSFGHGFPWGDVPDVGAKVLVVADGDAAKADALAAELAAELWRERETMRPETLSIDAALDQAIAAPRGPVVLADVADNAGGGAPSDATFVLERILARKITNVVSGLYWDPVAVRFCEEAGEGATLDLRVGGKCGPDSGKPVDLRATVRRIVPEAMQTFGTSKNGIGTAVWITASGIDLVLNTVRTQIFHPDAFTQLGIDPGRVKIIVVKSTQHFYAGFAPIAAEVLYVSAPGAITPDFAAIPYRIFTAPYWPKVADPWAAAR
ncbi:MAG: M81 family metallopeptidase [Alphaproteobacteria bacterium]|nr:M81 family metallopeptidase [Alphaproteobacteria bacterium]